MRRSFAGLLGLIALGLGLQVQAATLAAADLNTPMTVAVVVEGSLPGFSQDQLDAYVVQEMRAAHITAWHFETDPTGAPAANRIVWHFKLLPYAGGSVRYIGPAVNRMKDLFGIRRAVGIDAKIYLGGQYQTSTFDQATIRGGGEDEDLGKVIQRVLRSIVANALAGTRGPSLAAFRT
jgi:hypothetical protein